MLKIGNVTNSRFKMYMIYKGLKKGDYYKGHEYIIWIKNEWREWCKLNNLKFEEPKTDKQHDAFDKWLESEINPKSNEYIQESWF